MPCLTSKFGRKQMRSEDNLYICVYVNFEFRLRQTVVYLKGGVLLGNSKLHSLKVNVLFVLFRSNFSLGLIGVPVAVERSFVHLSGPVSDS